ncbi:MAG: hypothetical protein AB1512_09655 [Thermodesulfobacteriota bacterium]
MNFNPHCHVLCTYGVFYGGGWFKVAQALDAAPQPNVRYGAISSVAGTASSILRPPA